MDNEEIINDHIEGLEASVRSFSSSEKHEGEIWIAEAFLKNLGLNYKLDELCIPENDPPDVVFRDADFEIKEILDPNRKRHKEYKDALLKAKSITDPKDILDTFTPETISLIDLYALCEKRVISLDIKYPPEVRSKLDLLFYITLKNVADVDENEYPNTEEITKHHWRSISFIKGNRSCCFYASDDSPLFLKELEGYVKKRYFL